MNCESVSNREDRGITPVVAIILLFGLVAISAMITVIAGMSLMDTVETQQGFEEAETDMQLVQSEVLSARTSQDGTNSLVETNEDVSIGEGATVTLESGDEVATVQLRSLVRETENGHVTLEGGGLFRSEGGHTTVVSPPAFRVSEDGIEISLTEIDGETGFSTDELSIQTSPEANEHGDVQAVIGELLSQDEDATLSITVQSEHANAWKRHFERQAEDTSVWNVAVTGATGDEVEVEITHDASVKQDGIVIEPDHKLAPNRYYATEKDNFFIDAMLRNSEEEVESVNASVRIYDKSGVLIDDRSLDSKDDLAPDTTVSINDQSEWWGGRAMFDPGSSGTNAIDLTSGEKYTYEIEANPGANTAQGWFYYFEGSAVPDDRPFYAIADSNVDDTGDSSTVAVEIKNIGDEGGARDIDLEIGSVETTTTVDLDSGESDTIAWEIDESSLVNGEYDFVVKTGGDKIERQFTVEDGIETFAIERDLGVPDEESIDSQVVSTEEEVTIRVELTNGYVDEQTQNVTLDIVNEPDNVSKSVTIDGGETEEVDLSLGPLDAGDGGKVYEYNVSTEDDALDTVGSFLVVDEPAEFTVDITDTNGPVKPGEPLTVDAEVTNEGVDGQQFVWLEGFNKNIVDVREVDLDNGDSTDISLEWGRMDVPDGDATITAQTTSDSDSKEVDIDPLIKVVDADADTDPDGSIKQGDKVSIDVELESIAGDAKQKIELVNPDGEVVDKKNNVKVDEGETETITLKHNNPDDPVTGRWTIQTDDDEFEKLVVIERDAPDCGPVSYDGGGSSSNPYQISTVDQLQCIEANDLSAQYELVDDIDAHGTEYWNGGNGFEPIGEQDSGQGGDAFTGTFDGQGHTIEGMYIDRYDEPFVGIFAITGKFDGSGDLGEGSEVRRIQLEDIHVRGMTVVGGLVGGAGGTVEQVSVGGFVESQYQQVGGIIGHGHDADADSQLVSHATVEGNSPIVIDDEDEHPWQETTNSPNLGIGGIIGGTGYDTEVSTAYSTATVKGPSSVGGIAGWTSNNPSDLQQMYWADGDLSLEGEERVYNETDRAPFDSVRTPGAIAGRIGEGGDDTIRDSVYSGRDNVGDGGDNVDDRSIELSPDEMKGPQVLPEGKDEAFYEQYPGVTEADAEGTMANLDWDIWEPVYEVDSETGEIINEGFPRFAWELKADGAFQVDITDTEAVSAGEGAAVDVTVTSLYQNTEETDVTQTVALRDQDGRTVDSQPVTLPSTFGTAETESVTLVWQTSSDDIGTHDITVQSEDSVDSAPVSVGEADHATGSSATGIDGKGVVDSCEECSVGDSDGGPLLGSEVDIGVDVIEVN